MPSTAVNVYSDYQVDVRGIHERMGDIARSYVQSISNSMWTFDDTQIRIEMRGIAALPDVKYVEIETPIGQRYVSGKPLPPRTSITRNFALVHVDPGKVTRLGTLTVSASLENVYKRLRDRIMLGLITSAMKNFLVAAFILFIFQYLVTRHLAVMADFARRLDLNNLAEPLVLPRRENDPAHADELDQVTSAINDMRGSLIEGMAQYRLAEASLRDSEARFRLMTEASLAAICIAQDGVFQYVNPVYARMVGRDVDEMIGLDPLEVVHPDDRPWIAENIEKRLSGEWPSRQYEFRLISKDGRTIYVETLSVLIEYRGRPAILATLINVTKRKEAEADLQRYKENLEDLVQQRTAELIVARDQAEAANRAKSVFLANMSHELRTPLNAVLGFSNVMRNDPATSAEQRQSLDIINRSGEHLLNLINDVLDVARIEAGKITLVQAPFDLADTMREIVDMMRLRAEEKGLALIYDQASNFPRVVCTDAGKIRQVLINLINNAIKYTEQGSVTVKLESASAKDEPEPTGTPQKKILTFVIRDTGSGIEPQDQERIFEPFVQLETLGTRKGTGLGLTISRQYVELMGGSISVESTVRVGSCFRVTIPVAVAAAGDIEEVEIHHGRVTALQPGQPEFRIVIVEDQPENALLLRKLLTDVGFQVREAANGAAGVEAFREWHPHFIWMDRFMPVMDGLEATRAIRTLPGGSDVKIVGLSASAFKDQRVEAIAAGMDDFVCKPYRPQEIFDCLQRHLAVRFIVVEEPLPASPTSALQPLSTAALSRLPEDLRAGLTNAIVTLDSEQIADAVERICEVDSDLGSVLESYTARLAYTTILHALRAVPGLV